MHKTPHPLAEAFRDTSFIHESILQGRMQSINIPYEVTVPNVIIPKYTKNKNVENYFRNKLIPNNKIYKVLFYNNCEYKSCTV